MAVLKWLSAGDRFPYGIIHIHHNTGEYADQALKFVASAFQDYCFDLFVKRVKGSPPKGLSKEAWWREQRYNLFQEVLDDTGKDYPIVLAHNLDDCVEQYIISTLLRYSRNEVISYNGPSNTIRPFRTWKRSEIKAYALRNGLKWVEDPSNKNTKFLRNNVRINLIPRILAINPGLYNTIKKLIMGEKNGDKVCQLERT